MLYVNPFPAQSIYSFIPNLFTFVVGTARIVLCTWISQFLHPMPNVLWGGTVWNMYYSGSQKFLRFSTTCHNLDLLSQMDICFWSEALSLHA